MGKELRIGVAGLGTVGAETVRILGASAPMLERRCGRRLVVTAVSARDRSRDRGIDLGGIDWCDDARELGQRDDIDVVVEVIGGADGVARDTVEGALGRGKPVVTANKALIAHNGTVLGRMAEKAGVPLCFEASVAGGIPVIKAIREALAANEISRVYGILNGTCNYILSVMRDTGRTFDDVLAEAQRLGYAEADPAFDIDGTDTAHKLAILAAIAFGTPVGFDSIHVEGIRHVSPLDLEFADELGYRIKLLGIAERQGDAIQQRVRPCMVPVSAQIAQVGDVFNAVAMDANPVGASLLYGRGAGAGPTASAVVGDLVDIAAGRTAPVFGVADSLLRDMPVAGIDALTGSYYLRLMVIDRPGVLADLTAVFRDERVSVEAMIQRGRDPDERVPVVLTTHETGEAAIRRSIARISTLDSVVEEPRILPIEAILNRPDGAAHTRGTCHE